MATSEKENNYFHKGQKSSLREKPKSNVLQKKISDRLIAPTVTSLAKSGNLDVKEKPKPYISKPNPEQAVRFIKIISIKSILLNVKPILLISIFILHHPNSLEFVKISLQRCYIFCIVTTEGCIHAPIY